MTPIQQLYLGVGAKKKTYVEDVFNTYVRKGTGSNLAIDNGIDLAGEGGMVWNQVRNSANGSPTIYDTERGTGANGGRFGGGFTTDSASDTQSDGLQSFNSNGFTLGSTLFENGTNSTYGTDYVSYTFRKAPGFFDVVKYTGNATGRWINHSLGSVPGMIIVKNSSSDDDWAAYHVGIGAGNKIYVNSSGGKGTSGNWGGNTPTDTAFYIGSQSEVNADGDTFIAYVFAGGHSTANTARSIHFDAAGDYLSLPDHNDLNIEAGSWTIECWCKADNTNKVLWSTGGDQSDTANQIACLVMQDEWRLKVLLAGSSGWIHQGKIFGTMVKDKWHHVAIARDGNDFKCFFDGELTEIITDNGFMTNPNDLFEIGGYKDGSSSWSGNISNFRVVKGTAVYTNSFDVPLQPLTAVTNTKLLCCNGTSVTAATVIPGGDTPITSNGDPTVYTNTPFADPKGFVFGENEDQPIIQTGFFSGDGNSNTRTIDFGFEPQFIMAKRTNGGSNHWIVLDNMRGWNNITNKDRRLRMNDASEETVEEWSNITPYGMITGSSNSAGWNISADFIYLAIRRPDAKVGKSVKDLGGASKVFTTAVQSSSSAPRVVSGFPVDFAWFRHPTNTATSYATTRLTDIDIVSLNTNDSGFENSDYGHFDHMNGYSNQLSSSEQAWMFKRAPLFFDMLTYQGNAATNHQIKHNLGQTPEMIWIKNMESTQDWSVYNKDLNQGTNAHNYRMKLNEAHSEDDVNVWQDVAPTSKYFTVSDYSDVNTDGKRYLACLFGSVDGVSKVGSFMGSNSPQTITTGFQPRFLLIKNTNYDVGQNNTVTHWVYWDSVRGMASGNDPLLKLNTNEAPITDTDYVSVSSTGFTLEEADNSMMNRYMRMSVAQHYIYLAIA